MTLTLTAPAPAPTANPAIQPTGPPRMSPNSPAHIDPLRAACPGVGSIDSCTSVFPRSSFTTVTASFSFRPPAAARPLIATRKSCARNESWNEIPTNVCRTSDWPEWSVCMQASMPPPVTDRHPCAIPDRLRTSTDPDLAPRRALPVRATGPLRRGRSRNAYQLRMPPTLPKPHDGGHPRRAHLAKEAT